VAKIGRDEVLRRLRIAAHIPFSESDVMLR
jgi:hypothetical protein